MFSSLNTHHKNFLKNIDPLELVNKIKKFRQLNLKDMNDIDIKNEIASVLTFNGKFVYVTNCAVYPKGTKLFRIRILDGSMIPNKNLSCERDFWNPPSECITKYGRLNKPRESLLYTVPINPLVALQEVKLKHNDFFAVIVYEAKEEVKVNCIGSTYDYKKLGIFDKNIILVNELLNDFLRDEFSRDVGIGTEYLYRISEIIAKDYFDLPPRDVQDAWAYPSVKSKDNYNVCFRPNIARELLELHGTMIAKNDSGKMIHVKCISHGFNEAGIAKFYELGTDIQKEIFPEIKIDKDIEVT